MDTTQFRKLDRTFLLNVLYQLRAEIVREGQPHLDCVDTLIRAQGADPEARLIRKANDMRFKRNELSRAILRTLRDGPKSTTQIAAELSNHVNTRDSVKHALQKMMRRERSALSSAEQASARMCGGYCPTIRNFWMAVSSRSGRLPKFL